MWSIDLSDAYHHVGIHQDHQKYFTFAVETSRGVGPGLGMTLAPACRPVTWLWAW
jgi:hypothetical protein